MSFLFLLPVAETVTPKHFPRAMFRAAKARTEVPKFDHHFKDEVRSGREGCSASEVLKAADGSCSA